MSRAEPPSRDRIAGIDTTEILTRIRAGDRDAFATLYESFAEILWSVAILQTRSRDLAEDVLQDVMLWVWTHRDTLAPDLDIRVYLVTAIRNRARDLARRRRTTETMEAVVQRHLDVGVAPPGTSSPIPSTDAGAETREFREAYRRALTALDERERLAALLRWEGGMTLEQIARVLSLSIAGARKVLLRAQRKVRSGLIGHHESLFNDDRE